MGLYFIGKYRVEGALGSGAQGIVTKAVDTSLDRIVALKSLNLEAGDGDNRKALIKEAKTLARLSHPNIVTLYELIEQDGELYLALEYVDGTSLSERLKQGPIVVPEALLLIDQLAKALQYASDMGVLHGDLKPANIMLSKDGTPLLVDFGLAKFSNHDDALATLTAHGMSATSLDGTLPYMAPEKIMGLEVTNRADIFSLGAIFYEMIIGKNPFAADSQGAVLNHILNDMPTPPRQITPAIPAWVERLIDRMLEKDPKLRLGAMANVNVHIAARGERDRKAIMRDLLSRAQQFVIRKRSTPFWIKASTAVVIIALVTWTSTIILRDVAPPISVRMEQGIEHIRKFDREGAVEDAQRIFGTILADDPDHTAAMAGMALALMREYTSIETDPATLKRATALADAALAADPHLALANIAAAWAAGFNGDFDRALELYDQADSLDVDNILVIEGRVRYYRSKGRFKEAIAILKIGLSFSPDSSFLLNDYGDLLARDGRFAEAASVFRKAITVNPDIPISYANLGQMLHMQDRTDEAVSIIQTGLKIKADKNLYNNLGTYLYFQGRYEQSAKAFERVLELDGNSHLYLYWANLGDAYRQLQGHELQANRAYRQAIRIIKSDKKGHLEELRLNSRLALYAAKAGDEVLARSTLKKIFTRKVDRSAVFYRATITWEVLGDRVKALEFLRKARRAGYPLTEIINNPELATLRQDPQYHTIMLEDKNHE